MHLLIGNPTPHEQVWAYPNLTLDSPDFRDTVNREIAAGRISDLDGDQPATDDLLLGRLQALTNIVPIEGVTNAVTTVITDDDWNSADLELKTVLGLNLGPDAAPSWVVSSDEDFGRFLARKWGCSYGAPAGV